MPQSSRPPDSPSRRERRRRTHQRVDSNGDPPPRTRRREYDYDYDHDHDHDRREDSGGSPSKTRPKPNQRQRRDRASSRPPHSHYSKSASTGLSAGSLALLDKQNQKLGLTGHDGQRRMRDDDGDDDDGTRVEYDRERELERQERERERERRREEHRERKRRRREEERAAAAAAEAVVPQRDDGRYYRSVERTRRKDRRHVSGQALERGSEHYREKDSVRDDLTQRDGSGGSSDFDMEESAKKRKRRRNILIGVGIGILLLAIIIPVAVVTSKNNNQSGGSGTGGASATSSQPANSNLNGISETSIPASAKGGYLDPFDWYDTTDFNVTYTDQKVGGLYVMGLNSTWNDDVQANANVPKLNQKWEYGKMQMRGINIGGWLSIEPFITPSLFSEYGSGDNVVDEWALSQKLGSNAKQTIEKHYSEFVTEQTFADMAAAGFDHVRIPFSYWAVTTYDGDPYVPMVSWRYLLRAIEWARKHGLRVNLDLHGLPGSQNGWNHSGHQGAIGWLNGTDGSLNGNRSIEIHDQLSAFFTQPRYKNIITLYGLANEPRMTALDVQTVLTWSQNAIDTIRGNNYNGLIVLGDGFLGLENWKGKLSNDPNLVLDAHQYVIFNVDQIVLNHHDKVNFACGGWTQQAKQSTNTNTGFGPTIFGEWSQADTDCAQYLNNVGVGSRWEGTLNMVDTPGGATNGSVLTPTCPTDNNPRCDCGPANADPSSYSAEYKQWLLTFAEAQMDSFEQGWGWFYWTWKTESAVQWSYQDALAAGIMPTDVANRNWTCSDSIPNYSGSGLPENY